LFCDTVIMSTSASTKLPLTLCKPLDDYLDRDSKRNHPQNGGPISNHAPMTLIALAALGADDTTVAAWANGMKHGWPVEESDRHRITITGETFDDYLGRGSSLYLPYRKFLASELKACGGRRELLARYLPKLSFGQCEGLWHPLIRLSFALLRPNDQGVVDALAYLSLRYGALFKDTDATKSLLSVSPAGDNCSADTAWLAVRNSYGSWTLDHRGERTFAKIFNAADDANMRALALSHVAHLSAEELLVACVEHATRLYLVEPALTTLHSVTGTQACLDVWMQHSGLDKNADEVLASARTAWLWITALFVEKGCPQGALSNARAHEFSCGERDGACACTTSWEQIRQTAMRSEHVHLIKMVFTLLVMDEAHPNAIYRCAATRMCQRGRPW
jgi:hypothetical protein